LPLALSVRSHRRLSSSAMLLLVHSHRPRRSARSNCGICTRFRRFTLNCVGRPCTTEDTIEIGGGASEYVAGVRSVREQSAFCTALGSARELLRGISESFSLILAVIGMGYISRCSRSLIRAIRYAVSPTRGSGCGML